MSPKSRPTRRTVLAAMAATAGALAVGPPVGLAQQRRPATKPIPSTGEPLPVIGLGSWITFNVGEDRVLRDECADVLAAFLEAGGGMIELVPDVWLLASDDRLRAAQARLSE